MDLKHNGDKVQLAATVLKKLKDGHGVDDKEIQCAIEVLEPVVEFLQLAGREFFLVQKYLKAKLCQIKDFQEERRKK